jgi:hypothetical protein
MVHVVFDPSLVHYEDHVQQQYGAGHEYFRGPMFQRGYGKQSGAGIGDVFRGIWRFFLPMLKQVGVAGAEEALHRGQQILGHIKEGEPVKEAVMKAIKQHGSGSHKPMHTKRRPIKGQQLSQLTQLTTTTNKPLSRKRTRQDAFGLY